MLKISLIFSWFVFLLFLTSCINDSQKSSSEESNEKVSSAYQWEHVFVKDDQCEHEEAYQCAHVMLDFPVFKDTKMSKANLFVNRYIADVIGYGDVESSAFFDLNEVAHELIKDYQDTKSPALGSPQLWHVRLKSKFTYEKDDLICLLIVSESFMGGAHASVNKRYMTFNTDNGESVRILDRVEDKAQFKEIAEEKFRKLKRLDTSADLNEAGYQFPKNQFVLPANIGLDDKGYLLHYNAYEIAPYSMGPTDIRIEFVELQ